MSDMNQGSGTSILVAAVVGAAVGAGVALLFAPCSGKDTRGWLANRSREITDRTTSAFEQGRSAIRRATDAIGSDADAVTAKLRV